MAEVYCIVDEQIRLSLPTRKIQLQEPLAYSNGNAHSMRITVFDDEGEAADLTGISASGEFMNAQGNTVEPIRGTITGNVAEVILPPPCYSVAGRFKFSLNLSKPMSTEGIDQFSSGTYAKYSKVVYQGVVYIFTANHSGAWTGTDVVADFNVRTALWVEGHVEKASGGTVIDPGQPLGDVGSVITSAQAAATAATTAAASANAAAASIQIATVSEAKEYLGIT